MSQIKEQSIDESNNFNTINKDRCNPQPTTYPTYPVNLQEVDIFPGPHSYIYTRKNLSPKIINSKTASKAICGEEGENGESIVTTQPHQNDDDKINDNEESGTLFIFWDTRFDFFNTISSIFTQ